MMFQWACFAWSESATSCGSTPWSAEAAVMRALSGTDWIATVIFAFFLDHVSWTSLSLAVAAVEVVGDN
jgi:hypothetical protein